MSASNEKKIRSAQRAEGIDKKTLAERKEAEKKAKEKRRTILIVALIVIVSAAAIYLNSGLFYRTTTAITVDNTELEAYNIEAGSTSFSIAEANYVYNSQYMYIMSYMGSYASSLIDNSKPFSDQLCSFSDEENYTWDDYFKDQTYNYLKEMSAMNAYAAYAGIELDEEDYAQIDSSIETLTQTAKDNDWADLGSFLAGNYGAGCNESVVRHIMELETIANKVLSQISESFEYTAEEISAKYDAVKDSYDAFAYDYYYIAAETETDEEGNTAEPTEAAIAAAKDTAAKIKALLDEGKTLAEAVPAVVADAEPTAKTEVAGGAIETDIRTWLIDAARTAGENGIVNVDGKGSYVVVFGSRDNNKHTTEESGDMLYCDYIADQLLRSEGVSAWQEDVLDGITEIYSIETGFALKFVGR